MAFTSIQFLYFLLAVLAVSLVAGRRRRWLVLLAASLASYAAWRVPYLLAALAAVTLGSYLCAIAMEAQERPTRKRAFFWLGVALSLGVLLTLRYAGFIAENLHAVAALLGWRTPLPTGNLLASIGVSYYALQVVSYLLDVRDGAVVAERNLGRYALYVAFFPKLIQGPIERAEKLLPQLRNLPPFRSGDLAVGVQLLLWGLFQKVVVADRLAPFVDTVYEDVHRFQGVSLLVATYFFAAQLYFDFAGYTDMARGVARLFGIQLSQNFQSPYLSRSVAEFWRRWHISFSSWLLDYVFRPLQLHLRDWRTWGTPAALLATFLISGLWHGASWCFVAWGLLHGSYLAVAMLWGGWSKRPQPGPAGSRLLQAVQVVVTFHLVCLAWVVFRARSLSDALYAIHHLLGGLPSTLAEIAAGQRVGSLLYLGQGRGPFVLALGLLAFSAAMRAFVRQATEAEGRVDVASGGWPHWRAWTRTAAYAVVLYLIAFLGTAAQSFIYQQF